MHVIIIIIFYVCFFYFVSHRFGNLMLILYVMKSLELVPIISLSSLTYSTHSHQHSNQTTSLSSYFLLFPYFLSSLAIPFITTSPFQARLKPNHHFYSPNTMLRNSLLTMLTKRDIITSYLKK